MDIPKQDLHPHIRARMQQRGITAEEIAQTLCQGWIADDAKPGTLGKTLVFDYRAVWEGQFYQEKEVTVYYKLVKGAVALLTAKARYGDHFPRGDEDEG